MRKEFIDELKSMFCMVRIKGQGSYVMFLVIVDDHFSFPLDHLAERTWSSIIVGHAVWHFTCWHLSPKSNLFLMYNGLKITQNIADYRDYRDYQNMYILFSIFFKAKNIWQIRFRVRAYWVSLCMDCRHEMCVSVKVSVLRQCISYWQKQMSLAVEREISI